MAKKKIMSPKGSHETVLSLGSSWHVLGMRRNKNVGGESIILCTRKLSMAERDVHGCQDKTLTVVVSNSVKVARSPRILFIVYTGLEKVCKT